MRIDTKKLAEYSLLYPEGLDLTHIGSDTEKLAKYCRLFVPYTDQTCIEQMFETMKQWTQDQVAEILDENGHLNKKLFREATIWSYELNTVPVWSSTDNPYKRTMVVQICRWLVLEALQCIYLEKSKLKSLKFLRSKHIILAHRSGLAGTYKIPKDLRQLTNDFVSKEFILKAFDTDTCWIEFE